MKTNVTIGETHTVQEVQINIIDDIISTLDKKQLDVLYGIVLNFNRSKDKIVEEKKIKYKTRYESFWEEI